MRSERYADPLIWVPSAVLCAVGLGLIYSVLHPPDNGVPQEMDYAFFQRQLIWVGFGLIALLAGAFGPLRYYEALAPVFYGVCLLLLVAVLLVGGGTTQRWISLGPMRLQPSEFTKIALLFIWGSVLANIRGRVRPKKVLVVLATLLVPFLLILKQPDLGTAIILFALLLPVLYWRGIRGYQIFFIISPIIASVLILYSEEIRESSWPFGIYIVIIFVIAYLRRSHLFEAISLVAANVGVALIQPLVWSHLKPYQQQRITNFLDPGSDRLGAGWQVLQSKIAIGSGGLVGKGYLEGTQKALEFLPAKHTDFIFSVLGEEMGFLGAIFVLTMFGVLVWRALTIAVRSRSQFASTVCVGIAAYFFLQVFINVAMVTGMAPVTGIPIPFLSYGGSSLVVSCFFVGFLLNCSAHWYEY